MAFLDASAFEDDTPKLPPAPILGAASAQGASRTDLGAIAVSDELAELFHTSKDLLASVMMDPAVPANQKAQVLNSIQALLERITKTRTDLYNAERIRRIELAVLRVMREQTQEVKEAFLDLYKGELDAG